MQFLTDEDIESKLSSPDNLVNRLTVHSLVRGSGAYVPIEIKKAIAILGTEGESNIDLAEAFNLERSTVNKTTNGYSTGRQIPELKEVIQKTKSQLQSNRETAEGLAVSALLDSLQILPEAISEINGKNKAKKLSSVAKDMAAIANQMADKNADSNGDSKAVHVHLYAPKQKQVEDYEIIDV